MIPYDIDPSLHATEPDSVLLHDGFSAPRIPAGAPSMPGSAGPRAASLEEALARKSQF